MNNQATQEKLTQMRLWGMQRAFRGVLEGGIGAKYTADELIGHLVRIPVKKATHSRNKKPPGGWSDPDTATIAGWLF